jgi:hypothetical protein
MSLQWVDQCKITADARRRIRSHVMKGKNAGRPRPERKPLKSDRGGKRQLSHGSHTISDSESRTSHQALLRYYTKPGTEQLFWNDLCLASFAEIPSSESVRFIHQCKRMNYKVRGPNPSNSPIRVRCDRICVSLCILLAVGHNGVHLVLLHSHRYCMWVLPAPAIQEKN